MHKVLKATLVNRITGVRDVWNVNLLFPAFCARIQLVGFKMEQGLPKDTPVEADELLKNMNWDKAVAVLIIPESKALIEEDGNGFPAPMKNMRISSAKNERSSEKYLGKEIIDYNKIFLRSCIIICRIWSGRWKNRCLLFLAKHRLVLCGWKTLARLLSLVNRPGSAFWIFLPWSCR